MKKIVCIAIILVAFLGVQAHAAQGGKIVVAAADKVPAAAVSGHPGAASYFLFFDEKGKLLEAIENPYKNTENPGPSVISYVAGKGATVLDAGVFGSKAIDIAKKKGVTTLAFKGSAQDVVKKILESK